jgi:hypothetical protein
MLLGVACSSSEEATPEPTTPPGVFAPTPTIGDNTSTVTSVPPVPTTAADVERAAMYRVDPVTLETLPEFEPIPMGDWFGGDSSADGQWLAAIAYDETGFNRRLRLVHLPNWELRSEWEVFAVDAPLQTSDTGAVFLIDSTRMIPRLVRYTVGEEEPETVAELPFMAPWESHLVGDETFAVFGERAESGPDTGQAMIAVVDLAMATVMTITLPDVPLGVVREVELTSSLSGVVHVSPALVWDEDRSRVLIVHSGEDVVTEVAIDSGEVITHRFGPVVREFTWSAPMQYIGEARSASHRRTASLSPDGRHLYVGTMTGDFVVEDESWSAVTTSTGIMSVDTSTWEIVGRLDAPISDVDLASDGTRILAWGYDQRGNDLSTDLQASGLYVIDPNHLDVVAHHVSVGPEKFYSPFSFAESAGVAYATNWAETESNIEVIDLATGDLIATHSGEFIQIFGEVGVLGETR